MDPLVSVLIPVYNKREYLPACLRAVLGQTYRRLEVVLAEDRSTDGSFAICEEYAARDGRVRLLRNERNLGAGQTRNAALRAAKGDWICFVDADDVPARDMIEKLLSAALRTDSDAAVCGFSYVTPDGEELSRFSVPPEETVWEGPDCLGRLVQLYPVETRFDIALWNKLYRREAVEGVEMPDTCSEDYVFNARAFLNVRRAVHVPETLYAAVQSPGSFSRSPLGERTITAIRADRMVYELMLGQRPDLVPGALERLIVQCGDFSLLAETDCAMDRRAARREIRSAAREAYALARKHPGTEAARACRTQFVKIWMPRISGAVDRVYTALFAGRKR